MLDMIITFLTLLALSLKNIVYIFVFRPPTPPSNLFLILAYKIVQEKVDDTLVEVFRFKIREFHTK